MGFMVGEEPLSWKETEPLADYIRQHGIIQFMNIMKTKSDKSWEEFKWGDEIEYMLVKFDHSQKRVYLLRTADEILERVPQRNRTCETPISFHGETCSFQVESIPHQPFLSDLDELDHLLRDLEYRRKELTLLMDDKTEVVMTLTNFPRLGCPEFCWPPANPTPKDGIAKSLFFPDECYSNHPRAQNLVRNPRDRVGKNVEINVPIFKDTNTLSPFDEFPDLEAAKVDHVYMDADGFGVGWCCAQVTFQAKDITEARMLYDQLAIISPIMMALSAATPIFRGYLCDVDCGWNVISVVGDDRTDEERKGSGRFPHRNSRWYCINSYLNSEKFSDVQLLYDKEIYKTLMESNLPEMDHLLAQHIAHIFARDPLSSFRDRIELDDEQDTDHFESLQSTNWQNVRFKPPPANSDIGWRVELRTIEVQLTDFENAAFISFCNLLSRALMSFKCNFYIPLSLVQENMQRAQKRNAVLDQKFFFRKNIHSCLDSEPEIEEMSVNDIINGNDDFPGICKVIHTYLAEIQPQPEPATAARINSYVSLIQKRASGKLPTMASWVRRFVRNHPSYKQDSVVSDEITYDLMMECWKITEGKSCPDLIGCRW